MGFGLLYAAGPRMLLILFPVWIIELWLLNKIVIGAICVLTVFWSIAKTMQGYAREDDNSPEPAISIAPRTDEDGSDNEHIKYALSSFQGKLAEADRKLREQRTESGAAKSGPELMNKLAGAAAASHVLSDGSPESRAAAADLLSVFQAAANMNVPNPAPPSSPDVPDLAANVSMPSSDVVDLADSVPSPVIDFSPSPVVPEPLSLVSSDSRVCKNCGTLKGDFNFCTKCGLSFDM